MKFLPVCEICPSKTKHSQIGLCMLWQSVRNFWRSNWKSFQFIKTKLLAELLLEIVPFNFVRDWENFKASSALCLLTWDLRTKWSIEGNVKLDKTWSTTQDKSSIPMTIHTFCEISCGIVTKQTFTAILFQIIARLHTFTAILVWIIPRQASLTAGFHIITRVFAFNGDIWFAENDVVSRIDFDGVFVDVTTPVSGACVFCGYSCALCELKKLLHKIQWGYSFRGSTAKYAKYPWTIIYIVPWPTYVLHTAGKILHHTRHFYTCWWNYENS